MDEGRLYFDAEFIIYDAVHKNSYNMAFPQLDAGLLTTFGMSGTKPSWIATEHP